MIGTLFNSLEKKEKIMIYYIDSQSNVTQRIIRVVEMGKDSVLAFCYYRKQVRKFKIENILACETVKRGIGA